MRQSDHEYEERSFGDIQRAIDFENSMNDLESQLYYQHLSPKEVAQQVLKATCQFYDADWCGLIQVDLDLNLWTPFWWFNTGATDKTMLLTEEYESAEFLDRWVQTVRKGIPMVVSDAEATKEAYPAEYNLYQRLGIRSVIAVSLEPRPVALLAVRNPKRYIQQTSMLRILAYVLLASYNEQKMLNRLQMAYAPYGYDLVRSGRINKRKHELYELHINEQEAAVVRIVFDKYVYEGYGPQHIATYLNNSGYRARSGKCWHPSSIRGMVQNLTYTGVLRCGDARSELMPDLQIVPQEQFENAQRIRNERSVRSTAEAENRLPLNIHGKSLLAGNAYCGHCGAKLELTSSRKWRKMADGSLDDTLRIRYTCYGKLRKQTNCTGQTGYTVHILDEIIDKAVRQIFSKMRGIPKEQIVTKRYEKENAERKNHLQDLQTQRNKAEKDLLALKTEVLACIKGESVLPRETLAEMITAQEEKLTELENLCEAASEELEKTAELMDKVSRLYDELISYADLYDSANFEAKKMIINQLIRRVDVYRGYQINISFNFDLTPYIEGE